MKKDTCFIVFVLDMSGSMNSSRVGAINGFNTFLVDQRKLLGDCIFSLIMFDHEYMPKAMNLPITEVEMLTMDTYMPRGNTALYDAIGRTIESSGAYLAALPEAERPDKVIVAILTDGQENSSRKFDGDQVLAMIKHQQEVYNWEFFFLASEISTQQSPVAMQAGAANNLAYAAGNVGTQSGMSVLSESVTRSRSAK